MKKGGKWVTAMLDALFPAHCILCGLYCGKGRLCPPCKADLPRITAPCRRCALPGLSSEVMLCGACITRPPGWDHALAALVYTYPVDQLVHRFKFQRKLVFGQVLADEMVEMPGLHRPPAPDLLVPVPLHFSRRLARGFNQAEFLARELGKHLAIPVCVNRLQRRRQTAAQSGLDRKTRQRNIRGAFSAHRLAGLHVALVDDVMTTGTTLSEAALAARRAGAATVDVWVAARVP